MRLPISRVGSRFEQGEQSQIVERAKPQLRIERRGRARQGRSRQSGIPRGQCRGPGVVPRRVVVFVGLEIGEIIRCGAADIALIPRFFRGRTQALLSVDDGRDEEQQAHERRGSTCERLRSQDQRSEQHHEDPVHGDGARHQEHAGRDGRPPVGREQRHEGRGDEHGVDGQVVDVAVRGDRHVHRRPDHQRVHGERPRRLPHAAPGERGSGQADRHRKHRRDQVGHLQSGHPRSGVEQRRQHWVPRPVGVRLERHGQVQGQRLQPPELGQPGPPQVLWRVGADRDDLVLRDVQRQEQPGHDGRGDDEHRRAPQDLEGPEQPAGAARRRGRLGGGGRDGGLAHVPSMQPATSAGRPGKSSPWPPSTKSYVTACTVPGMSFTVWGCDPAWYWNPVQSCES